MKKQIFSGVGTALITPFKNGKIDYASFKILIDRQIWGGASAIIVLGTTGEPCTICDADKEKIIKFAIEYVGGRIKVIVGCGGNCTKEVIKKYKLAEKLKADGALIVTPYYNKCTQKGILEHYKKISQSGDLPIIVYNVPSRTGVNIEPKTLEQLCEIKNICGIKEASGNVLQIQEYFRLVGEQLAIYSGDDTLNYYFACLGGSGAISVLSNIAPKPLCDMFNFFNAGDLEKAKELHFKLLPLTRSLFLEVNPIPVKAGLEYLGLCQNELRLPLTKMEQEHFDILKQEIDNVWARER